MNNLDAINQARSEASQQRYGELKGKRFGNVIVVGFAETNNSGNKRVLVKCDCGNEYPMTATYLLKRHETRCLRCSKILEYRGQQGYEKFLTEGEYWVNKKTPDDQFRKLKNVPRWRKV